MPKLTAAEIALQEKYAELRRKKEQKKKLEKQQQAPSVATDKAAAAAPVSAVEKAKALLAQRQAAAEKERQTRPAIAAPAAEKLDPVEAAKRALEAKKSKAVATKRPTLKRPAVRRPKSATNTDDPSQAGPSNSGAANGTPQDDTRSNQSHRDGQRQAGQHSVYDHEFRSSKRHRGVDDIQPTQEHIEGEATLFVGDLPPYQSQEDLHHIFSHFGPVENVRLLRSECYGFVRFDSKATAEAALASCTARPLVIAGHELRVNQSYGTLPDWKRCATGGAPSSISQHPKVLEARKQGDLIADALEANQMLQTHGMDFYSRPQEREMVAYDDL